MLEVEAEGKIEKCICLFSVDVLPPRCNMLCQEFVGRNVVLLPYTLAFLMFNFLPCHSIL
jgi:hypothetical protein